MFGIAQGRDGSWIVVEGIGDYTYQEAKEHATYLNERDAYRDAFDSYLRLAS